MAAARYLALVNSAAGGGRCGKLVPAALEALRAGGLPVDVSNTQHPGHGIELARAAYREGYRQFIACGGDGTSYEILNGVFPEARDGERIVLGFQPLGTGNSFLRDFSPDGLQHATRALLEGRRRPCDVLRLTYEGGELYFMNLLSVGFTADVAALTNRRFKRLGPLGYLLGVFACLVRLQRRVYPLRVDDDSQVERGRALFLSFNNSKFTGGKMMIAPQADTADGHIEIVRWGPIGRLGLIRNLGTLYDGTHLEHPLASRRAARLVHFELEGPVDVMVDGEVLTVRCERIDVLPSAIDVVA